MRKVTTLRAIEVLSLIIGIGLVQTASGVVLDFESLSGLPFTASPYEEDGFTVSNAQLNTNAFDIDTIGGNTSLASDAIATTVTLTQIDGAAFDLLSMDLAKWVGIDNQLPPPYQVHFVGQQVGGGSTAFDVVLSLAVTGFENFLFPSSFQDLTSVSWMQLNPSHRFDNIVVQSSGGAVAVPVPGVLWLLAGGLALLGFQIRKH